MTQLQSQTVPGGKTVFVASNEFDRGSKGPFYVVYSTDSAESRWGYRCGNCDSFDTAMDTMGRVECNECGNVRKPDEWDAAHE
ncbi:GNAT family acetyltransferase [Haloferax mediterranei ATCC 33500]|uniref:GNAT family acetyltraansferase n=2 Tax=Haloferax TaxID=2251 RepID=I3R811_HALMT|nr:DUF5816 domain-containing protein [Haloferax mediterranei]AFK20371.1 hypothetical protein HFX_2693 [Haloferax mediterranei ATCC 33500]AHZ23736.1 GNAT family acetyltraansferase [Haloferax mediterranei ATCC 33500]ELZ99226.1 hypothetical protein C439_15244 [Haloferax mediterranei ATCC 33500]MDX5986874.1 DUF5816 domain-containing protein [Haloferax mediterranei ATCC 33500]QCQ76198.1 GNAT family acetyltransferase [Haloferax mediterranei ATCC 33500]